MLIELLRVSAVYQNLVAGQQAHIQIKLTDTDSQHGIDHPWSDMMAL